MVKAKRKKEPETPEQRPIQLYLYLGVVETGKDLLRHCYLTVDESWEKIHYGVKRPDVWTEDVRFYGKRFGLARPGSVISIEHDKDDDRTVFRGSARIVGSVDDESAASWSATSAAIKTAHDARKRAKKEGSRDLQMELLEPLRAAYRALHNRHQRTAFIARVSVYLTS